RTEGRPPRGARAAGARRPCGRAWDSGAPRRTRVTRRALTAERRRIHHLSLRQRIREFEHGNLKRPIWRSGGREQAELVGADEIKASVIARIPLDKEQRLAKRLGTVECGTNQPRAVSVALIFGQNSERAELQDGTCMSLHRNPTVHDVSDDEAVDLCDERERRDVVTAGA